MRCAAVKDTGDAIRCVGVFAEDRLKAGHVVLYEEACLVSVALKFASFCCNACLNVDLTRLEPLTEFCSECAAVRWCSKDCREKDRLHSAVCCSVLGRIFRARTRLAALKMTADESTFVCSISQMAAMKNDFGLAAAAAGIRRDESGLLALVREFSGRENDLSLEELNLLASIEQNNAMSITNRTPMGALCVGRAVFRMGSRFNHGCWPNLVRIRDGGRMRFVVVRPVAKGEELCISYVPPRLANKVVFFVLCMCWK